MDCAITVRIFCPFCVFEKSVSICWTAIESRSNLLNISRHYFFNGFINVEPPRMPSCSHCAKIGYTRGSSMDDLFMLADSLLNATASLDN